jgi:ATP-dependent RNA helicase RhlB
MPPREQRQGMLFSATLSYRVLELAYEHMNNPEKVTAETETVTASRVRQAVYFPAKEEKLPLLIGLLSRIDAHRSMVFVNTKIAAEKVTRALEHQGFTVATLSGDVPQAKRERLLGKFQRGEIELLVATDVAARGLHIPDVSHVFNYDLPNDAEDYVHRIGRTARLGAEGDAISFACDLYAMGLPDIEAYIEQKIPVERIEPGVLVAPPRRARSTSAAVEDDAADDARNTAGPKSGHAQDGGRRPPRSRRPKPGDRSSHESHRPTARPAREAIAAPVVPAPAAPAKTAAEGSSLDPSRRKRRRRGGRGRRREGGEAAKSTKSSESGSPRAEPQRDRKPPRERPARNESNDAPRPGAPAADPARPEPGLFRRIARLFSPR